MAKNMKHEVGAGIISGYGFPNMRVKCFQGFYQKDSNIWGLYQGPPILQVYHIHEPFFLEP